MATGFAEPKILPDTFADQVRAALRAAQPDQISDITSDLRSTFGEKRIQVSLAEPLQVGRLVAQRVVIYSPQNPANTIIELQDGPGSNIGRLRGDDVASLGADILSKMTRS